MAERSSIAAVPKEESVSLCMPNKRPPISKFTPQERRTLLTKARLVHRQEECDIRSRKKLENIDVGRILIITPKKIGSAPQRNLIRRRLKALYYEELHYTHGYDIVIYCRKGSAELSFQALKEILSSTFVVLTTGTNIF